VRTPAKLFQHRMAHNQRERNRWAVARDGQRFLLSTAIGDPGANTIQVVLNWAAGLKSR
jgi:hypothetical protein